MHFLYAGGQTDLALVIMQSRESSTQHSPLALQLMMCIAPYEVMSFVGLDWMNKHGSA